MRAAAARPAASSSAARPPKSARPRRRCSASGSSRRRPVAAGLPIDLVYVESGSAIERELYLSLLLDRETSRIAFIASAAGGMNIEEVAAKEPERILRADIDPAAGLQCVTSAAALPSASAWPASRSPSSSASRARSTGSISSATCALVEVNPLIVTKDGALVALDAKINVEANALFRQPGARGAARSRRRKTRWSASRGARAQLRLARRQHRLHGQRRRARDGDHGPHQAARRRARELPRRRRHRDRRARDGGIPPDPVERARARGARQHLRRHRPLRRHRRGHRPGRATGRRVACR